MKLSFNISGLVQRVTGASRLYKMMVVLALNVFAAILVFFLIIGPQIEDKKRVYADYQETKKILDKMIDIKSNMDKYRKEYAQSQELLGRLLRELPETKDIPNLLRSVSAIGSESKIKVTYFEPGTVIQREFYGEFPFKIRYNGPFHNIGYFFDGVRRTERIINITNFSLSVKGPPTKIILEGECLAKSYVYMAEAPKAKKEGTNEPPKK